jgi:hypothetical protein
MAGSMSLCPSLLTDCIIYLSTFSKLFNELIEADPGVLSGCLAGLLALNEHLAEAFGLAEDSVHESVELGIIVLVRLKLTQFLVLVNLLDDMGNEANPCSLPFMHNIVEPDSSEVPQQSLSCPLPLEALSLPLELFAATITK